MSARKKTADPAARRLEVAAKAIRRETVLLAHRGNTPHIASGLSIVEILTALYFGVMRIDPGKPKADGRDRFILSKGHGCIPLYAVLHRAGFFGRGRLGTFAADGSDLPEHPYATLPGIEYATGSLGHGLAAGAGMALGLRMRRRNARVFVLMGDGECDEGSVWEAAAIAATQRLGRLVGIVDRNTFQATDLCRALSGPGPLERKWRAFGWRVLVVDGHDLKGLVRALDVRGPADGVPTMVVADTVKGKGVSFMERDLEWHYRPPQGAEFSRAMAELD